MTLVVRQLAVLIESHEPQCPLGPPPADRPVLPLEEVARFLRRESRRRRRRRFGDRAVMMIVVASLAPVLGEVVRPGGGGGGGGGGGRGGRGGQLLQLTPKALHLPPENLLLRRRRRCTHPGEWGVCKWAEKTKIFLTAEWGRSCAP